MHNCGNLKLSICRNFKCHRKVSAESLDLFSCLHQGDGGGGGDGREQRVRDGQEQVKSGRKPVKWVVPRRRGIVPDGMVQTRLQNFVVKFPNLGMVGGCNQTGENSKVRTTSCQSDRLNNITDLGGKRKHIGLGDKETAGQPKRVKKLNFLQFFNNNKLGLNCAKLRSS